MASASDIESIRLSINIDSEREPFKDAEAELCEACKVNTSTQRVYAYELVDMVAGAMIGGRNLVLCDECWGIHLQNEKLVTDNDEYQKFQAYWPTTESIDYYMDLEKDSVVLIPRGTWGRVLGTGD